MVDRQTGIDCHVHLCDPVRFPYRSGTIYTPTYTETGTAEMLAEALGENSLSNAVLIAPMAGYQSDNSCLIHGLRLSKGRYRGIAIVEADVQEGYLDELAAEGVVGIRIDLVGRGKDYLEGDAWRLVGNVVRRGWILDLQCEGDQISQYAGRLSESGVKLVIDHVGRPDPDRGLAQSGFHDLLKLSQTGRCWVKLSGPFRFAKHPDFSDGDVFVRTVVDTFGPERLVWGSDWPFLRLDRQQSYAGTLEWLRRQIPDSSALNKILWDTPASLFGFSD